MLLRNESKVRHSIDIKLVFDDNTTRELQVYEGLCVHVSYRKNGCLRCGTGVITEIKPYIKRFRCRTIESAVITLDMSEENYAHVDKIELDDIIDIKVICYCDCCPENQEKPEPPKPQCPCMDKCKEPKVHYSCLVGTPITNKGVIAHE